MTAMTAFVSDLGTQLAAKSTVLSCGILTFTLLPPVLSRAEPSLCRLLAEL